MKKSDRLKIVILGITGLLILIGTGIFIFIGQSICTMAGVGLFVIVCLGMVVVAGKKDDQTETIEQLNQTISEQSRILRGSLQDIRESLQRLPVRMKHNN